jgi:putative oxidoreductase
METGLLVIRVVLGGIMAAHGAQKLFGWFGGPGLAGTGAGSRRWV